MTTPSPARAPRWLSNVIIGAMLFCGIVLVLGFADALSKFMVQAAL